MVATARPAKTRRMPPPDENTTADPTGATGLAVTEVEVRLTGGPG